MTEKQNLNDLIGKQFGELTVIEPDTSSKYAIQNKKLICKCSCGKMTSVALRHLLDGSTKACGHLRHERGVEHQAKNFAGNRALINKYKTNMRVIQNQTMQPNNTSGVKGVDYHKGRDEWRARVHVNGKEKTKWFKRKEDAIAWRKQAVEDYYKPQIDLAIANGDLEPKELPENYKRNSKLLLDEKLFTLLNEDGYDGYSMSNNARMAYANNEMPKSKWTKGVILDVIEEMRPEIVDSLKKVSLQTLRDNLLIKTSWHHTGSWYNETDFYSIDDYALENLTEERIKSWIAAPKVKKEKPAPITYKGTIEWIEWGGTRHYPTRKNKRLDNVNIEERGSFYIVTDDNGEVLLRKKMDSNGTYVTKTGESR